MGTTITVLKPNELFYSKILPLLKEKGMNEQTPRKDWPLNIQLRVLRELLDETPNTLLAKYESCVCVCVGGGGGNCCCWPFVLAFLGALSHWNHHIYCYTPPPPLHIATLHPSTPYCYTPPLHSILLHSTPPLHIATLHPSTPYCYSAFLLLPMQ